jgi:LisH protein
MQWVITFWQYHAHFYFSRDLNHLVLDYLILEGYQTAAQSFAEEAARDLPSNAAQQVSNNCRVLCDVRVLDLAWLLISIQCRLKMPASRLVFKFGMPLSEETSKALLKCVTT